MNQVLHVYKEVKLIKQNDESPPFTYFSYDEKSGIQTIGNTSTDLPPIPREYPYKNEMKQRINLWLQEINEPPAVFRWEYGLDSLSLN